MQFYVQAVIDIRGWGIFSKKIKHLGSLAKIDDLLVRAPNLHKKAVHWGAAGRRVWPRYCYILIPKR